MWLEDLRRLVMLSKEWMKSHDRYRRTYKGDEEDRSCQDRAPQAYKPRVTATCPKKTERPEKTE